MPFEAVSNKVDLSSPDIRAPNNLGLAKYKNALGYQNNWVKQFSFDPNTIVYKHHISVTEACLSVVLAVMSLGILLLFSKGLQFNIKGAFNDKWRDITVSWKKTPLPTVPKEKPPQTISNDLPPRLPKTSNELVDSLERADTAISSFRTAISGSN